MTSTLFSDLPEARSVKRPELYLSTVFLIVKLSKWTLPAPAPDVAEPIVLVLVAPSENEVTPNTWLLEVGFLVSPFGTGVRFPTPLLDGVRSTKMSTPLPDWPDTVSDAPCGPWGPCGPWAP